MSRKSEANEDDFRVAQSKTYIVLRVLVTIAM